MQLPSPEKQLDILGETTVRLRLVSDEETAVEIIFDALEAIGFTENCRLRLARIIKEENVITYQYSRGDYGGLPLRNLTIALDAPHSVSGYAYEKKQNVVGNITDDPFPRAFKNSAIFRKDQYTRSFLIIPIFDRTEVIALLSCDSTELDAFSPALSPVLQAYQYLLGSVLSSTPAKAKEDPDLTRLINRSRRRRVLVLGKDTGDELELLLTIRDILHSRGYEGVLVKEQPDIPELSNEDKVRTFAGLCRFVLLENTFASGQIAECKICSTNRIVTAVLRKQGGGSSFMVTDYFKDFDFMEEFTYSDDEISLATSIGSAIDWAETKITERKHYFNSLYPWRAKPTGER
jgi:hypothetical protein